TSRESHPELRSPHCCPLAAHRGKLHGHTTVLSMMRRGGLTVQQTGLRQNKGSDADRHGHSRPGQFPPVHRSYDYPAARWRGAMTTMPAFLPRAAAHPAPVAGNASPLSFGFGALPGILHCLTTI